MPSNQQNVMLNDRELQVWEAFKHLARTKPETPTQKEIAEIIGCSQPTVFRALNGLQEKGYIGSDKKVRRSPRSYRVTNFKRVRHA